MSWCLLLLNIKGLKLDSGFQLFPFRGKKKRVPWFAIFLPRKNFLLLCKSSSAQLNLITATCTSLISDLVTSLVAASSRSSDIASVTTGTAQLVWLPGNVLLKGCFSCPLWTCCSVPGVTVLCLESDAATGALMFCAVIQLQTEVFADKPNSSQQSCLEQCQAAALHQTSQPLRTVAILWFQTTGHCFPHPKCGMSPAHPSGGTVGLSTEGLP